MSGLFACHHTHGREMKRTRFSVMSLALRLSLVLALGFDCLASFAFDVPEFAPNVVDTAGVMSTAEIAKLNGTIAKLREESHIFAAVLVVPSTQPETIEQAAEESFRQWALGQKGV